MRLKFFVVAAALALVGNFVAPRTASAAFISLTSGPLSGPTAGADFVDFVVDLGLNGAAPNLVGLELYVEFAGLIPQNASYQVGSFFVGTSYFETHGRCSAPLIDCNYPVGDPDSPSHYLALLNVLPPDQPSGPGTLFSLRFTVDPAALQWSLNLFGEEGVALTSEKDPPCDFDADPECNPFPPILFEIVSGTSVPEGTARVNVTATPGVPEPAMLLMIASGIAVALRRYRAELSRT